MKTLKLSLPLLAITGLVLSGCPSDDVPPGDGSSTTDPDTTAGPGTSPTTTTIDPDTTASSTMTGSGSTTDEETDSSSGGPGPFEFEGAAFDEYTQVDRMGFPAINTGLNLLGDKDAYNAASPADDAALMFATNIFESLDTLHLGVPGMQTMDNTGLDDDLGAFGLTPCVPPQLPMDSCDDQGGPFAIPDTLFIDLDDPAGFPNGRALEDPVMDIILAVLLLDLSDPAAITTFLDLDGDGTFGPSINPLANDVAFPGAFPYLAPAN